MSKKDTALTIVAAKFALERHHLSIVSFFGTNLPVGVNKCLKYSLSEVNLTLEPELSTGMCNWGSEHISRSD